ncbi:MAG TPA: CoA pyrophosphatase [Mycobacteriales bacterium]|nr:CoA pyrophosphatase [Mycobacteriales bacterium]
MSAPGWLEPLLDAVRVPEKASLFPPPAGVLPGLRQSAVLVLFGEGPQGPDVLLIERSAHLRSHAGQPAFPGGGIDPGDDGPVGAALREAQEETGLDPAGVDVLATLPELWVPPSGNVVTPVLAWWREPSDVMPADAREVAAVARVPLADLADPANRLTISHPSGRMGPAFEVADMLVWGFTAGVLDRLLALAGWERPWDRDRVAELPAEALRLAMRQRTYPARTAPSAPDVDTGR